MTESNSLKYLTLILIMFLPFLNNCEGNRERAEPDEEPLSIDFESLNESYKENQGLQIIDSRTLDEFKSGHIPGALAVPVQDLESSRDTPNVLSTLKKSKEVYIYCSAGGPRSQRAAAILREMGFKKAYFVEGGIAQWIAHGNPLQKE